MGFLHLEEMMSIPRKRPSPDWEKLGRLLPGIIRAVAVLLDAISRIR